MESLAVEVVDMAKPKKIDWETVEHDYVTGKESLRALCARFAVSKTMIMQKSKDLEWVRKRKEFRSKALANAVQKSMRAREEEILEGLRGTDLVNKRAMELLENDNFVDYMITLTKTPCREMESISKVFVNVEETRRLLRGVMKPVEEEKLRLEREKWEHELRKEQAEETGKGTVNVVFEGELEEYSE